MTLALMLANEVPSINVIDLRFNSPAIAGLMIGIMLLGVTITIHHIIREMRHV